MAVDRLMVAATKLHECLCAQVALMPVDTRPARCTLIAAAQFEAGVAQLEDMCACGTAYVRIGAYVPSEAFPDQQQAATKCGPPQWSLTLELGILRCPPIGTADVLPSDQAWFDYTTQVMADAQVLRQALFCCYGPARPNLMFLVGGWEAVGPEGLCGGGRMSVQVQVIACNECE